MKNQTDENDPELNYANENLENAGTCGICLMAALLFLAAVAVKVEQFKRWVLKLLRK